MRACSSRTYCFLFLVFIFSSSSSCLISVCSGALGTLLGALAGYALCGEALASGLFVASDAPKLAAALCAKNIGGGVNFVAVRETHLNVFFYMRACASAYTSHYCCCLHLCQLKRNFAIRWWSRKCLHRAFYQRMPSKNNE